MTFLFQLGRQPELSRAEIEQILKKLHPSFSIEKFISPHLLINIEESIDAEFLIRQLGGTIKIAEEIPFIDSIENTIIEYLSNETVKIHFSLSGENARDLAKLIKKELKARGKSVRYIESNNTATILYNNLVVRRGDFTVVGKRVFVTLGIQPIEEWSERDYGRPGRDSKSGMLPPKLARIMINLSGASTNETLFDPFCGSGTILTEAATLGFTKLIGFDISPQAIQDTKKNVAWIEKPEQFSLQTKVCDARQCATHLGPESVDVIVSEPYMGKPLRGDERKDFLGTQAKELSDLFTQSFQAFSKILKKGAIVIFILPRFQYEKDWVRVGCEKNIENFGFTIEPLTDTNPFILYHRPGQFVGREIWKFRKK